MYGTVRSWKSSIMNVIGTEWSELSALWLKNCYIWLCFTLELSSAYIDQSAPNLDHKILKEFNYESNQDRMVRVIYLLFKKTVIFDFVYTLSSAYIDHWAVSTELGQNICVQQNLNEFDHRSSWTKTTGVICSWIVKYCCIWLCLLSNIYKYKPISTKLGHNEYEHKILDGFDNGSSHTRSVSVICPWNWNRKIELQ